MAWTDHLESDCNDDKVVLARRDVLAGIGAIGVLAVGGAALPTASPAHAEPASACGAADVMASAKANSPVEATAGGVEMPATDISARRYYRRRRRYWGRHRRWRRRYWRRARVVCRRRWYRGRLVRVCRRWW
jgi:hypothetical protein